MGELLDLILDGCNHSRRAVSYRGYRDPGPEVDQAIAVGIDDDATASLDSKDWHCRSDATCNGPGLPRHEFE
jgi:hypothetical protein